MYNHLHSAIWTGLIEAGYLGLFKFSKYTIQYFCKNVLHLYHFCLNINIDICVRSYENSFIYLKLDKLIPDTDESVDIFWMWTEFLDVDKVIWDVEDMFSFQCHRHPFLVFSRSFDVATELDFLYSKNLPHNRLKEKLEITGNNV